MKKCVVIFIVLVMVSCTLTRKNQNNIPNQEYSGSPENVDSFLAGDWGVYEHVVSGTITVCNACPKIKFTKDNMAIVTLPSGDRELYQWKTTNKILRLTFPGADTADHYFKSSAYRMEFDKNENFKQLSIYLTDNDKFILGK